MTTLSRNASGEGPAAATYDTPVVPPLADTGGLRIQPQVVAGGGILGLVMLALLLFTSGLGSYALSDGEAARALTAWRAVHAVPFPAGTPDSVTTYLGQATLFTVFGPQTWAARLPTALAAVVVVMLPLLFVPLLSLRRALLVAGLLMLSPSLLASARFGAPVVWEVLFVGLALWTGWRWHRTMRPAWGVSAIVLAAGAWLLAGPTGHVLLLTTLGALLAAERLTLEPQAALDDDTASAVPLAITLRALPWRAGLLGVLLVVVLGSTAFMLNPAGLGKTAQALGTGLGGWWRASEGTPFYALLTSVFYDTILWVVGVGALVGMARRDTNQPLDVFFACWLALGALAGALYSNSVPSHSLWVTLPLIGLVSGVAERWARADDVRWHEVAKGQAPPRWAKLLTYTVGLAVLLMTLMQLQTLARMLARGMFSAVMTSETTAQVLWPVLVLTLVVVLGVTLALTAASMWGERVVWRGVSLALLTIGMIGSVGAGYRLSSSRGAADARELWHLRAHGPEQALLYAELARLTNRVSGGLPFTEVVFVVDDQAVQLGNATAWAARDQRRARAATRFEEAVGAPVILAAPRADGLGPAGYVGSPFVMGRAWPLGALTPQEWPLYWLARQARQPAQPRDTVVLWVRNDVYLGLTQTAAGRVEG